MQERTASWLQCVDFFSRTSVQQEHVRLCLQLKAKTLIYCELVISNVIDGHVQVMPVHRCMVPHLSEFGEHVEERIHRL
jgi:hypothetical protein